MSTEKELAYRYDLFITTDWRDRFDTVVNENIELPAEGRILDVNCGTGAHAIEMAERMRGKGEVIAVDPSKERIALAIAKARLKKVDGVKFECNSSSTLPYPSDHFDAVIGDASMLAAPDIESLLAEMVRVTRPGGRMFIKMATHGSFDEFFSIYWEALHDCGLEKEVWGALEGLIKERGTISEAEQMAERAGLREVETVSRKEEFFYESGKAFLEAPIIEDSFLTGWLSIVPEDRRRAVSDCIVRIVERERHGAPFDVSIKATVISGLK